jgi:hypothetical protein
MVAADDALRVVGQLAALWARAHSAIHEVERLISVLDNKT